MYTIGQFSGICRVTVKTLRHYDKVRLLRPAYVDPDNGYRYYTREQVGVLRDILFLKEVGIPLDLIRKMLSQGLKDPASVTVLDRQREALLNQINQIHTKLGRLASWKQDQEVNEMTENRQYDVVLKHIPATLVRSKREVIKPVPEAMSTMILQVLQEIETAGGMPAGAPAILMYSDHYDPESMELGVAWPVGDKQYANDELPEVQAACCLHIGPYDELCHAYEAVFSWINANGYQATFPIREISLNDPRTTAPERLATEIVIPLVKK